MPLFNLVCKRCKAAIRRILKPQEVRKQVCGDCGGTMRRVPGSISTQMMERLDNGAMARTMERLANAEELYKDHAANDPLRNRE